MKKLITISCIILTISVSAQVQFGVVAGFNTSGISTGDNNPPNQGWTAGTGIKLGGIHIFL